MIDVGKKNLVFRCDECPIVEQLDRRLALAGGRGGMLQFDHCSCAKTDDEFFMAGYCSDAWSEKPAAKSKTRRRRGKTARRLENKKRKSETGNLRRPNHRDNPKFKRRAARKARRSKTIAMAGSGYKKIR